MADVFFQVGLPFRCFFCVFYSNSVCLYRVPYRPYRRLFLSWSRVFLFPPLLRDAGCGGFSDTFERVAQMNAAGDEAEVRVEMSFLEIYIENVYDLLAAADAVRQVNHGRQAISSSSPIDHFARYCRSTNDQHQLTFRERSVVATIDRLDNSSQPVCETS